MQQRYLLLALLLMILLLLLPPNATTITAQLLNSSDTQALLDFASAVPHARKLNWDPNSSSICTSWTGVTCTPDATRVLSLRLPGAGFRGPLPPNTLGRLDALASLSLRNNHLTGDLPSDLLSLPDLRYVYLQKNNFSGTIPSSLSSQLIFLDMSFNSLKDSIPIALANLTQLAGLNLQNNSLSGSIPDFGSPRLKKFNLSNNFLNGSIPTSLQSFPASSFDGNSQLCGKPLEHRCPSTLVTAPSPSPSYITAPSPSPSNVAFPPSTAFSYPQSPSASYVPLPKAITQKKRTTKGISMGTVTAIAAASTSAAIFLLVMTLCYINKKYSQHQSSRIKGYNPYSAAIGRTEKPNDHFESGTQNAERNKLVFLHQYQASVPTCNFDLEDLLRASAEVMGKGTYGTTYKAILENGTTVVVKRLKEVSIGKREVEQLMENAGRVKEHPNVVSLRAYYYSKDEKLLVYDYVSFGSLHHRLHGGNSGCGSTTTDWESRVHISLGAARGIAHIHSAAGKLSHGNIKASNILLTQESSGCISDFGISPTAMGISTRSNGYGAPEVNDTTKSTQKEDVYSFGVVLLEMLTGKTPVFKSEANHKQLIDLPMWVQSVVREEWTAEVFDRQLMKYPDKEESMVQMLQTALACVETVPEMRPSMDQVIKMIEEVYQKH